MYLRNLRKYVRKMRKMSAADALFPTVRKGLLRLTMGDPARWWYLSELAEALDTTPSSLQREVEALAQTGIFDVRRDGRRTYYKPNEKSAIFEELRGIVLKTMGAAQEIRAALAPIAERLSLALVYGSAARGSDRANSDVDLLVVADDLTLEELYDKLARAERKLRRKVNPTLYTSEEFRRKRTSSNPFLQDVLSGDRILLIGSEDGLEAAR
ncbi:MAG TPA: nucleotidyltransferase domain-containing protein [Thermoanaerobaculia bacterium]|nr:nucleotidyltransferase domain-containing protein [Thermoanaerobaculia bacterium]